MASTLDLHTLTATVFNAGAKLVLVGDPAQIGVINGPGGMLPALAAAGHGIELTNIHRFTNTWEADASLRLRAGDKTVIDTYQQHGRLHTVTDPDHATAAVFSHWQTARSRRAEVMMLARTRDDVDQLNALAKTAAQTSGDSHGPELHVGHRTFQAGDVIRTRRNQRSIGVGDSHVRNGDRYTILTTTERRRAARRRPGRPRRHPAPTQLRHRARRTRLGHHHRHRPRRHHRPSRPPRPARHRPRTPLRRTHPRTPRKPRLHDRRPRRRRQPPQAIRPTASTHDILTTALTRTGQQDAAHTLLERAGAGSPSGPTASSAAPAWAPAHSTNSTHRTSGTSTHRPGPSR